MFPIEIQVGNPRYARKGKQIRKYTYGPQSLIWTPGSVFVLLRCWRMVNCAKAVNRFVMGIDLIASKMKQEIVHEDLFISRTGVNHFTLDNGKIRSALSICEND